MVSLRHRFHTWAVRVLRILSGYESFDSPIVNTWSGHWKRDGTLLVPPLALCAVCLTQVSVIRGWHDQGGRLNLGGGAVRDSSLMVTPFSVTTCRYVHPLAQRGVKENINIHSVVSLGLLGYRDSSVCLFHPDIFSLLHSLFNSIHKKQITQIRSQINHSSHL